MPSACGPSMLVLPKIISDLWHDHLQQFIIIFIGKDNGSLYSRGCTTFDTLNRLKTTLRVAFTIDALTGGTYFGKAPLWSRVPGSRPVMPVCLAVMTKEDFSCDESRGYELRYLNIPVDGAPRIDAVATPKSSRPRALGRVQGSSHCFDQDVYSGASISAGSAASRNSCRKVGSNCPTAASFCQSKISTCPDLI
jgi:hypothetical protein